MQDLRTGHMVTVEQEKILKELKKLDPLTTQLQAMQKACDEAIPDRKRHGPVFQVGEVLIIRGGRFRVDEIRENGIFLKGLPTKSG